MKLRIIWATVFFLLFSVASYGAWSPEGLDTHSISLVSSGRTLLAVDQNAYNRLWMKSESTWTDMGIDGVSAIFADQTSGINYIGSESGLWKEENGGFTNIKPGCSILSGTVRSSTVYVVLFDNTVWASPIPDSSQSWTWAQKEFGIASPVYVFADSGQVLFVANSTGLYKEVSAGSENFGQIPVTVSNPQKIIPFGADIWFQDQGDGLTRIVYDGSWSSMFLGSCRDLAADDDYVYLYLYDNKIYKTKDGIALTAFEELGPVKNNICASNSELFAGTAAGIYSLDLGLSAPTVAYSFSGGYITLNWDKPAGIVRFELKYSGSPWGSSATVDLGSSQSYTLSAAGVNVVWVIGYDRYDVGSIVKYRFIPDPNDKTPPPQIANLSAARVESDTSAVIQWTEPGDNRLCKRYEIKYRIGSAITALNWSSVTTYSASNDLVPGQPGSTRQFRLMGLPPGQTVYAAVRTYDAGGVLSGSTYKENCSLVSNNASFVTLPLGYSKKTLAWYYSAATGYGFKVSLGDCPGAYTEHYDISEALSYTLNIRRGSKKFAVVQAYSLADPATLSENSLELSFNF